MEALDQGVSSGDAMNLMEKISDEILPEDMGYAWSGTSLQEKRIKWTNWSYTGNVFSIRVFILSRII